MFLKRFSLCSIRFYITSEILPRLTLDWNLLAVFPQSPPRVLVVLDWSFWGGAVILRAHSVSAVIVNCLLVFGAGGCAFFQVVLSRPLLWERWRGVSTACFGPKKYSFFLT